MNKLCAFITADSRQAYRMSGAGLLLFLLAAGALLVLPGIPHQDMYGHDIALFLDGGWRVLQGQRPHADFTSHLGPVSLLVVAFGMKIAGPTADAVTYGVCAFFLVATCWAWLIARQRAAALTALLFSLFVGATVIATNTMGYEYDQTSYAGLYNRFGHALLSIVFVEVFLPKRAEKTKQFVGGLSTGAVTAILLFLKINYFAVAAAAVLFGFVIVPRTSSGRRGLLVGFASASLVLLTYLDFAVASMARDIAVGIQLRGTHLAFPDPLGMAASDLGIYCLLAFWLLFPAAPVSMTDPGPGKKAVMAAALIMEISDIILLLTNMRSYVMPLYPVPALIILEYACRLSARADGSWPLRFPATAAVALLAFGMGFLPEMRSVVHSASWDAAYSASAPGSMRFGSASLSEMIVLSSSPTCGKAPYAQKINEGIALLQGHITRDSRIAVLDFGNLFSFALGQPSPRGDMLLWHYQTTFSEKAYPDPERTFDDVTLVMIPKCEEDRGTVDAATDLYSEYLEQRFRVVGESALWVLRERIGGK